MLNQLLALGTLALFGIGLFGVSYTSGNHNRSIGGSARYGYSSGDKFYVRASPYSTTKIAVSEQDWNQSMFILKMQIAGLIAIVVSILLGTIRVVRTQGFRWWQDPETDEGSKPG